MNTSCHSISRRTVLRGLGTAVALPLLDSMMPGRLMTATAAAAQPAKAAVRMGFFYVCNGMHMPDWTPRTEGPKYELSPTLQRLADNRDHFNVLSGLSLNGADALGDGGGDHARSVAAFLTGAHPYKTDGADIKNDISVDQVAAQHVGDRTRFASLELGLEASAQAGHCDSGYSCAYASNVSWRNSTSPMSKEVDPGALFDRLFAGQTTKETRRAKSVREKYRKSIIDFVLDDAQGLQKSLPATDQRKLDEYLYSVRDIEKRLGTVERVRMNENGIPDYPRPLGVPKEFTQHSDLMMDMIAIAFQTDSTRILSFMFANAGSNRSYPEVGVNEAHHELSHHGKSEEKQSKIATINRFHADRFNYLLTRLRSTSEGNGTVLDNCMLIYGSGISDGDRHNHDDLPIVMAGGGGGKIKTGRHIRYANNTPLCNLYLKMLNEVGAKVDRFGDSTAVLENLG